MMVLDNRERFFEDRLQLFCRGRFGLLSLDLAGSNKTDLSDNLVYTCYFSLTLVYAHYGGVSITSV